MGFLPLDTPVLIIEISLQLFKVQATKQQHKRKDAVVVQDK